MCRQIGLRGARAAGRRPSRLRRRAGQLVIALVVCASLGDPAFAARDQSTSGHSVRVAILGDCSGSAAANRIPPLTEPDVKAIASIALDAGGSVQTFIVGKCTSDRPYAYMPPRPLAPRCLKVAGACVESFRRFREDEKAWLARRDQLLRSYGKRVMGTLAGRPSTTSDVIANLNAALNYLRAPSTDAATKRILYIVSDLQERPRSTRSLPTIPDDIVTVWLNPDGIQADRLRRKDIYTSHEEAARTLTEHVRAWRENTVTTAKHVARNQLQN